MVRRVLGRVPDGHRISHNGVQHGTIDEPVGRNVIESGGTDERDHGIDPHDDCLEYDDCDDNHGHDNHVDDHGHDVGDDTHQYDIHDDVDLRFDYDDYDYDDYDDYDYDDG